MTGAYSRSLIDTLEGLPAVIREERVRRGLSLRDAATQMGYTFADLCRFEMGQKDVRLSTVIAMLRWVDAPVQGDEEQP